MESFAYTLSQAPGLKDVTGRPVLDRTGLKGTYYFRLVWNDDDDFLPALQDELGLRLVPQKESQEMLVINHIEKPSEN
jgi:uncharacterized protein (TIGR03435 family)